LLVKSCLIRAMMLLRTTITLSRFRGRERRREGGREEGRIGGKGRRADCWPSLAL